MVFESEATAFDSFIAFLLMPELWRIPTFARNPNGVRDSSPGSPAAGAP
jgi:hypothetical protein